MQRNLSKSEHLPSRSWVDWSVVGIRFCSKRAAGHAKHLNSIWLGRRSALPYRALFFIGYMGYLGLLLWFPIAKTCPGPSRDESSQHQSSSPGKIREKHTHRLMASVDSNGPHSVLGGRGQTSFAYQYHAFSDLRRVEAVRLIRPHMLISWRAQPPCSCNTRVKRATFESPRQLHRRYRTRSKWARQTDQAHLRLWAALIFVFY